MLGLGCLYPELHAYRRLRLLNHHCQGGYPSGFRSELWPVKTGTRLPLPWTAHPRLRLGAVTAGALLPLPCAPLATPGNWLPRVSTRSSKKQLLGWCYRSPVSAPHGGEGWGQTWGFSLPSQGCATAASCLPSPSHQGALPSQGPCHRHIPSPHHKSQQRARETQVPVAQARCTCRHPRRLCPARGGPACAPGPGTIVVPCAPGPTTPVPTQPECPHIRPGTKRGLLN